MSRKFSFRVAKAPKNWYGFKCPVGGIFGTDFFVGADGIERKYDYVFLGESRRRWRPDGSFMGTEIKVFIHHHIPVMNEDKTHDDGYFRPIWVQCVANSLAMKLLNKHVKPDYSVKPEFSIRTTTEMSSGIKRPKTAGAIYTMVRNGQ